MFALPHPHLYLRDAMAHTPRVPYLLYPEASGLLDTAEEACMLHPPLFRVLLRETEAESRRYTSIVCTGAVCVPRASFASRQVLRLEGGRVYADKLEVASA